MSTIAHDQAGDIRQRPLSLRLIGRIFAMLGPHWRLLACGNVLVVVCAISDMAIIREVKKLIDHPGLREARLGELVWPLALACIVNRLSGWAQWLCTFYATNRAMLRLRKRFFGRLQTLSKSFFTTHRSGWLIARNTGDMFLINHFMTFSLMMSLYFGAAILFAFREMLSVSPLLLIPTAFIIPVVTVVTLGYQRRMSRAQRAARELNSKLVANLSENVKGVRVVHAFTRHEINLDRFDRLNRSNSDAEVRVSRLNALFLPSIDFLGVVNTAVVVSFALLLTRGAFAALPKVTLTTGELVAYISYMNVIVFPIRMLIEMYSMAMSAMAAAERVFEIIDLEPAITDPPAPRPLVVTAGRIDFEKVWFRYGRTEPWIVCDLSLSIPGGATVALVGETGAGKTTLSNLVVRFHDVQRGRIRIDGTDIRHCSQEELHRRMAIVLQEGYLFSGTVMDNLRFRAEGLSDARIVELARRLGVHEAIGALADGYQTEVKEGGRSLSQGQRQIISLARALAADPEILILDEPTSSMDVGTERIIQRALERLVRGRTTIIIAHRLSTIRNADTIIVIGKEGVKEQGTHRELVRKGGAYAKLVGSGA
jgi:ABC-type multidrug transport system fused ATPase/permease subunit